MYREKRARFYAGIAGFWPDLYGEEYALYDVRAVRQEEVDAIRVVTERVGAIFFKMAQLLRHVPDETLLQMGYPEETLKFVRLETLPVSSVVARLDLIAVGDSYKCIEINADTPTFIKELFSVNGRLCEAFGMADPNLQMEGLLRRAVQASVRYYMATNVSANVVFTAHVDNVEDRDTVLYLMESVPGARFVGLHELRIERGVGLFDERGERIDVLYRQTYPIENCILDVSADGEPIGYWLLELVELGLLAVVNPPSSFLLQNKAVQAMIWGLHEERNPYFTEEEHGWIAAYFLPTYLEATPFLERGISFVRKPAFGREGDTVSIFDADGELALAESQQSYGNYLQVYQQYVEQPRVRFQSVKGEQEGELLIGSFLLNGKAGAIGYRVGGKITNNFSYYLGMGVARD